MLTAELLRNIAMEMVDQPDSVRVELEATSTETVLHLFVAADDIGKMIGKQGRTARSLRTILAAIGMKNRHHYALDIIEFPLSGKTSAPVGEVHDTAAPTYPVQPRTSVAS